MSRAPLTLSLPRRWRSSFGVLLAAGVCLVGCDRWRSQAEVGSEAGGTSTRRGVGPDARSQPGTSADGSSSTALEEKMLRDRVVLLGTPIDDDAADKLIEQLHRLQTEDSSAPILVYVNSPGGGIDAGLRILDTMLALRPTISTVVLGTAAGIAAYVAAAGDAGHREALREASYQLVPLPHSLDEQARAQDLDEHLVRRLAAYTGQSSDAVRSAFEQGRRFTSEQAMAWGLVDRVIDRPTT